MSLSISNYFQASLLAQAAYANLVNGMSGKNDAAYLEALKKEKIGDFSDKQALKFADRYTVVEKSPPNELGSGFSATLFKEEGTGKQFKALIPVATY